MPSWMDQSDWGQQLETVVLVLVAGVIGGIVGLEREWSKKPAGLRTHMFVAAAACLLVVLGEVMVDQFSAADLGPPNISGDPVRIIQAIVVGISFLGAGTILHQGGQRVEGLTTAASILLTAGLGIAVAAEKLVLAFALAIVTVIVLLALGGLENRYFREPLEEHSRDEPPPDDPQPAQSRGDSSGGAGAKV